MLRQNFGLLGHGFVAYIKVDEGDVTNLTTNICAIDGRNRWDFTTFYAFYRVFCAKFTTKSVFWHRLTTHRLPTAAARPTRANPHPPALGFGPITACPLISTTTQPVKPSHV